MVAAFKTNSNNEEKSTDDSEDDEAGTSDEISIKESEELFAVQIQERDELDEMEEGSYSDVINFGRCENDHHYAFEAWKHTNCFVHTLQLVVKVFESAPAFRSSVKQALDIVRKVNKSCKATEQQVELAGKKLVKNCLTRWDSLLFCDMSYA
uniref:Uncharacterized protein n=1 Tax=Amphimedon queenslandica TaxID=400682 RepID=A0A1X7TJT0_AMPQE